MTEAQYRHLRGYFAHVLRRDDFLLVGGPGIMKFVFPKFEIVIGDLERRPFRARNRFFSLSFSNAAPPAERMLMILLAATERYALRFPWLIDAVKTGRVFLEDVPAMLPYLTSSPSPCRTLFEDFARLRRESADDEGAEFFDFDALRKVFLHVAEAVLQRDLGEDEGLHRSPRQDLRVPMRRRWLFIDLLQGTTLLSDELRLWVAGLRDERVVVLGASNWREIRRHMNPQTIVFCFGDRIESSDCIQFLLGHLDSFRHVAFVNVGETDTLNAMRSHAPRKASFFLGTPICRFGALMPTLPPSRKLPYIPLVSRKILRHRLYVNPIYDFFVSSYGQQDLGFLYRHDSFFARRKFLVGMKWGGSLKKYGNAWKRDYLTACREIRRRFPGAVFVPTLPLHTWLYLLQATRNIVIIYPPSWVKNSYTLSTALLAGRGIVTTAHPAIARIDPACFRIYDPSERYDDRDLEDLFCGERGSLRAARHALSFARRRLEFHKIIESVVLSAARV